MSMNTKPKSFDVSKIVIDSNFPSREKNKISDKTEPTNHWVKRYAFEGMYWRCFLFVILLKANPCTPRSAKRPPVIKFPSFNKPVEPDRNKITRPEKPKITELIFNRVIFSSL